MPEYSKKTYRTCGRNLEGSTTSNSIERFLAVHADDPPGAKLVELMQYCIDTVSIEETIAITVVLVDVKIKVDADGGNTRECFS